MTDDVKRGRRRFLLIAGIFFLPMALAWVSYFGPESWHPQHTTNNGELITPAEPLELGAIVMLDADTPVEPWAEKWTLLQVINADCDESCLNRIADMRQLRKSLHRRRERVQRLLLLPSQSDAEALAKRLGGEHPLLRFGVVAPERHAALLSKINRGQPLTVALVDPLGNYLMRYEPDKVELRGMYKDIMKLLKLSNIG